MIEKFKLKNEGLIILITQSTEYTEKSSINHP